VSAPIDRRRAAVIGRHARLELVFMVKAGRTVLAHAYAEPPLRVGRGFPEGPGRNALHVILASSAPGIFGGDLFEQKITLERGASVRLTSQSALQVHPGSDGGTARLRSTYDVGAEAELRCHWDPLIPFTASRLEQQTDVELQRTARLSWSDAFMSGREGRGERWQFHSLRSALRVTRSSALEYVERFRIVPEEHRLRARWVADNACYFGSVLRSGYQFETDHAERLHAQFAAVPGLHAAADALSEHLLLVRLAATAGPCFHEARRRLVTASGVDVNV
jgi:urease accessory protein UreH